MSDDNRGKLILCATPMGNLKDITLRVLESLNEADVIACEDTRHSLGLLTHYGIKKKLTSYHEHNKYEKAETIAGMIKSGLTVALITDAGTPAISDPGEVLVSLCHREGLTVTSLPGPCALITALTLSGLPARRFVFEGFLPPKGALRREVLESLSREQRTVILYESPHHLLKTLKDLRETLGDRKLSICRELTKQFESVIPTSLDESILLYEEREPRGEFVLVIEGRDPGELKREAEDGWKSLSLNEHMELYESQGLSRKEAMKAVASDRGLSKREVYAALILQND